MKHTFLKTLCRLIAGAALNLNSAAQAADNKPTVFIMLAGNMGYGDLGCYGSGGEMRGMPTPRIDELAGEWLCR